MAEERLYLYRVTLRRPAMLVEGPTAEERATVARHGAYLQALLEQGRLVLAGRTDTTDAATFGIAIVRAESDAAARRLMEEDPFVREGLTNGELFPFHLSHHAAAPAPE